MLAIADIETKVCDIVSYQLGVSRHKLSPRTRLIEDLNCDSLDLIELIMELEVGFGVAIPDEAPNPVYKSVFTRSPFRLSDFAELIYLQQGNPPADRRRWKAAASEPPKSPSALFSQLSGRWSGPACEERGLFESLGGRPTQQFRRCSDGMRCLLIPGALVDIGSEAAIAERDEQPLHRVEVDSFLIDAEPVSTTAYCRFLNSTGEARLDVLADWMILDPLDDRQEHMLIEKVEAVWQPRPGAEHWPMILVSWYGANAYSLWANAAQWEDYRDEGGSEPGSYLPSECQWEYAARGVHSCEFPWGNDPAEPSLMRFGQHRKARTYEMNTLPLAKVNEELGMSPFGAHHMAGNIWQWCRDWYDERYYDRADATQANPLNRRATGVRSERGGSWIGIAELCRSSHRRGRNPVARGRCLGFRCVSPVSALAT